MRKIVLLNSKIAVIQSLYTILHYRFKLSLFIKLLKILEIQFC